MKMIRNRKADIAGAPYAGSGKLTDYKKDGSWMMNQIEKGYDKCDRGIKIDDTDPSHKRFAAVSMRIASESFEIKKSYSVNGNEAELKWMVEGDFNDCEVDFINSVADLAVTKMNSDMQGIISGDSDWQITDDGEMVSFGRPAGVYAKVKFLMVIHRSSRIRSP